MTHIHSVSGPLARRNETSPSRSTLQSVWIAERHKGTGAVLAALANAAALDHFHWRRPGHASDPMRHARAMFETVCREGGLLAN